MPQSWRGYSWTGGASMAALLGRGNDALSYLQSFLQKEPEANTMYAEGSPVIETPLSAARSLQDMVLESWGGTVRVFPGVPDAWKEIAFHNMRAEGAFLVSAGRSGGATTFVRISSLAGAPCRVRTDLARPLVASGTRTFMVTENADGTASVDLRAGEEVVLVSKGNPVTPTVAPVVPAAGCANFFGGRQCH